VFEWHNTYEKVFTYYYYIEIGGANLIFTVDTFDLGRGYPYKPYI